jgi:general secretion pathway protein H
MCLKSNPDRGFTMIELLVVMVIISLVTAFTIPSIRTSLLSDQLKTAARRLIGLVTEVSQDAVSNQSEYILNFDLENNRVWATRGAGQGTGQDGQNEDKKSREKKLKIPESVKIVDITSVHGGKLSQGAPTLYFSKKGYVDKTAIHLRSDDGRDMTIVLSPFMGVARIFDSYVELEDKRVSY